MVITGGRQRAEALAVREFEADTGAATAEPVGLARWRVVGLAAPMPQAIRPTTSKLLASTSVSAIAHADYRRQYPSRRQRCKRPSGS